MSMAQLKAEATRLHDRLTTMERQAANGMLDEAGLDALRETHCAYIANREARRATFQASRPQYDALNALWAAKSVLDAIHQDDDLTRGLARASGNLAQHAFDTYAKITAAIRSLEDVTEGR
jgi:hypothetical protein